jgi:hypothetical protein
MLLKKTSIAGATVALRSMIIHSSSGTSSAIELDQPASVLWKLRLIVSLSQDPSSVFSMAGCPVRVKFAALYSGILLPLLLDRLHCSYTH